PRSRARLPDRRPGSAPSCVRPAADGPRVPPGGGGGGTRPGAGRDGGRGDPGVRTRAAVWCRSLLAAGRSARARPGAGVRRAGGRGADRRGGAAPTPDERPHPGDRHGDAGRGLAGRGGVPPVARAHLEQARRDGPPPRPAPSSGSRAGIGERIVESRHRCVRLDRQRESPALRLNLPFAVPRVAVRSCPDTSGGSSMQKRSMRAMFAGALAVALMLLGAAPALAHEGHKLGDLEMEVGWGTEPAYSGEVNSVQILLVHDGKPVVDLGDTLDVEVTFGDQTQTFSLEPFFEAGEFGTPGDYRAWLIPTPPGQYCFPFPRTIKGEDVDETFRSGPKTFDDVQNPQSVEFPVQQPSTGELAERIDRVEPRLPSALSAGQADVQTTSDDASSAKTIGLIGLVVGAIGLIVAIVALVASRRKRAGSGGSRVRG